MAAKHFVQTSIATVAAGAILNTELVRGEAVGDVDAVNEVREGAQVKAVYFEIWIRSGEVTPGSFIFTIEKVPGAVTTLMSAADAAALGTYDNKKNILYTSQGLVNDADSIATPVIKGWVKIPKSKARFGLKDQLMWNLSASGAIDLHVCGFVTYKEYY